MDYKRVAIQFKVKDQKIASLKRRLKEYEQLYEMNLFWQNKYFKEGSPTPVRKNLFYKEKDQLEVFEKTDDHYPEYFESMEDNAVECVSNFEEQHVPEENLAITMKESMEFVLTPRKAAAALNGVKQGKNGDSTYVKNLAMAIFGPELLMNSSYSGKAAVGGKKKIKGKEEEPRPALPQSGMIILADAFKKRLHKENPEITPDEEKQRAACFRDAISDKIKYLRKRAS